MCVWRTVDGLVSYSCEAKDTIYLSPPTTSLLSISMNIFLDPEAQIKIIKFTSFSETPCKPKFQRETRG